MATKFRYGFLAEVEVLPVPPEYVDKFWRGVCLTALRKIPGYDQQRTHARLLVGLDQLWVACSPQVGSTSIWGVVITSISERPPSERKHFQRKDPAQLRSLTVHIAGEYFPRVWIDSAVERVTRYAKQHGCRQLFLMVRKDWTKFATRFWYSGKWESVAITRDRPSRSTCEEFRLRNTPGYFRPMVAVPASKWSRHLYGVTEKAYFKEATA